MCVIIIGTKKNVSKEEVMRAWQTNPDGFGMLIKNKIHEQFSSAYFQRLFQSVLGK